MRTATNILLFLTGLSFILFALFAFRLGLDPDPGFGKYRISFFLMGIMIMLVLANLAKVENLAENGRTRFIAIRERIYDDLRIPKGLRQGLSLSMRKRLAFGFVSLAGMAIIIVYVWFATAGTWHIWPASTTNYDQLANAFVEGHVYLDEKVSPLLLSLPDPYNIEARTGIEYIWDASLYQGKYYLYWGPLPAVIVTGIKLIHPFTIGDNLIVFSGVMITMFFQILIITMVWMRFFQGLPIWTLILGVFLAGFVMPITWMINHPEIYEAAIISAQAFLMGGIYFGLTAILANEVSPHRLAVTSILWACAIACRTVVIFEVFFAVALLSISIFNRHRSWISRLKLMLVLGLPILLCGAGLGIYNFVRFGSLFEFGLKYQLTLFDLGKHGHELYSVRYVPPNIRNYFFNPPEHINVFPCYRGQPGNEIEAFGIATPDFYYSQNITGLIYTFPFALFAVLPLSRLIVKRIRRGTGRFDENEHALGWIVIMLSGMAFIAAAKLLTFFFVTTRYYADVTPILVVLTIMGFWFGYQALRSAWLLRFVYAGMGFALALVSIIFPTLLALLSSQRVNYYSPTFMPTLDVLCKSVFQR